MSTSPSPNASRLAGYLMAAGGAVLFSTKSVAIKLAYATGVSPETLLMLRMGLSAPAYLIIGVLAAHRQRRRGDIMPDLGLVLRSLLVGALGYWLASYTDFLGLTRISAQFERLILFTYPAMVLVFGALWFGEPIRRNAVAGVVTSYVGLTVLFGAKLTALEPGVLEGGGFVLVAAAAFSFYLLLAKPLIARIGSGLFTCIAMSGAAGATAIQFLLTQPLSSLMVGPRTLGYGAFLAIGTTILPSFLMNAGLHRISPQANGAIGTLSPIITIVLAALLLGERVTVLDAVGAVLVLAGVGWFTLADLWRSAQTRKGAGEAAPFPSVLSRLIRTGTRPSGR
jgi:drug/metabolite transporter (DMT)-like permease